MPQAETILITSRRNFLVRALGFTAAGATVAVPIVTVGDAKARVEHHVKQLEEALRDYYVGLDVRFAANWHAPDEVRELRLPAHFQFQAMPPNGAEAETWKPSVPTTSSWREYNRFLARQKLVA